MSSNQIAVLSRRLQQLGLRVDAITPEGVAQAARDAELLSRRLAERTMQQTVIEQVCLLLAHRQEPDGLQIMAALCRMATEDPAFFRGADKATLQEIIERVRARLS